MENNFVNYFNLCHLRISSSKLFINTKPTLAFLEKRDILHYFLSCGILQFFDVTLYNISKSLLYEIVLVFDSKRAWLNFKRIWKWNTLTLSVGTPCMVQTCSRTVRITNQNKPIIIT